mmetsp:Transcript_46287/g.107676  ORF Transcript_46287/g.107676 Transcript_46287/m.107676 type:complete len:307 (+) Transcript_46287:64-984(+)
MWRGVLRMHRGRRAWLGLSLLACQAAGLAPAPAPSVVGYSPAPSVAGGTTIIHRKYTLPVTEAVAELEPLEAWNATTQSEAAWQAIQEVQHEVDAGKAVLPFIKAQLATAKAAAQTAAEMDMQATQLHNSWLTEAIRASKASAHEFLQSIKQESAAESAKAQEQLAQATAQRSNLRRSLQPPFPEATPYSEHLKDAPNVAADWQMRAQALAAASLTTQQDAFTLASSANKFQQANETQEARRLMIQAHSLFNQSAEMRTQAQTLQFKAQEIIDGLPAYKLAEQAANTRAAYDALQGTTTTTLAPLY